MEWNVSFFVKQRVKDAVIDRQSLYRYSNVNRLFLNVFYHLENTSVPYGPLIGYS